MDLGLRNKVALVTGASRGLGYATARQLAQEGTLLALNSRNPQKLSRAGETIITETGVRVKTMPGDVNDPDLPASLIEATVQEFGGLDILITNSGGPAAGTFDAHSDAAWYAAIESCLMAHVRLIRAALPYLRKSTAASVLTITSYSVKQPIPNMILSNSVRAATVGMTKTLALEMGKEGIRFNSILPAWTATERVTELMEFRARQNGTTVGEENAKQAKDSPLGRIGEPDEFARAAAFLVSPAASYLTGVMLSIDGGMYKGIY